MQRPFVALIVLAALAAAPALAQRARRVEDPATAPVAWSVFVGAHDDAPAQRTPIVASAGAPAPIAVLGWTCSIGAPQRTVLGPRLWSESRALDCARGDARVSATAACMVDGRARTSRPGALSLGAAAAAERVDVELECAFGEPR